MTNLTVKQNAAEIDYSPLDRPATPEEIAAYKQTYHPQKITWVGLLMFWLVVLGIGYAIAHGIAEPLSVSSPITGQIVGFSIFGVFVLLGVLASKELMHPTYDSETRKYTFAHRNGFTYTPHAYSEQAETGVIFNNGEGRAFNDIFDMQLSNISIELGNFSYSIGSGRSQRTVTNGYMRLKLPRHVPNMVLDGKANNQEIFGITLSNGMNDNFRHNQVLKLEGDFNDYFTLYCPKEYERDALYIFTPDLMALMIDEAALYDVEAVENDIYIYQKNGFTYDEATLSRLMQIAEIVGNKMEKRTHRYADERVGDRTIDEVAHPGQRLKQRPSLSTIVSVVTVVASLVFFVIVMILNLMQKGVIPQFYW